MASFTITIPDAVLSRVLNDIAYGNGYTDTILDEDRNPIPNPVTKGQFVKEVLRSTIVKMCRDYEVPIAGKTAADTATISTTNDINTNIVITVS